MSCVPGMPEGRVTDSSVLATCHTSFLVGAEERREVTAARSASSWVAIAASGEAVGEAEKKSMLRPSVRPDSHTQPSRAYNVDWPEAALPEIQHCIHEPQALAITSDTHD